MTHNVRVYVPEEAELIYRSLRDCGKTEKLNKFLRNSRKFELLLDGVVQLKIQRLNCNCARSTKVSIPLPIKGKHDVELINSNIVKRHNLFLNFNSDEQPDKLRYILNLQRYEHKKIDLNPKPCQHVEKMQGKEIHCFTDIGKLILKP